LCSDKLQPRLDQLGLTPEELVAYALNLASMFEVLEGDPIVLADPDDDMFIYCAEAAGASYIVSGDHHLVELGKYGEIMMVAVHESLALLRL
jgi:uncharacterized protein